MQRSLKRTISFSMPSKRLISLKLAKLLAVAKLSVVLMQTVQQAMVSMHFLEILMPRAMVTLTRHVVERLLAKRLVVIITLVETLVHKKIQAPIKSLLKRIKRIRNQSTNLKNGLRSCLIGLKSELIGFSMILTYIRRNQRTVQDMLLRILSLIRHLRQRIH